MPVKPNDVDEGATSIRSSVMLPVWMDEQIARIAARRFSSRAQIIREGMGEWLRQQGEFPAADAEDVA